MMRKLHYCIFLFFLTLPLIARTVNGNPHPEKTVLFIWWNVENLFDTDNDPRTEDDDFTPSGRLHWTEKRLTLKQMRIRHLLSAVEAHPDYRKYPDVLAFAEVENRTLFQETLSGIKGGGYKTIYFESADPRGIDVGLAYNPRSITPGSSKAYNVPLEQQKPTRKIIVAGLAAAGHPFHVILNHWPSRSFDVSWTEPKRIAAARVARHILDSLLLRDPAADIILMGDFNDEPDSPSLKKVLGSTFDRKKVEKNFRSMLFNCWSGYEGVGSYLYRNRWQQIDQILLSRGMLDNRGLFTPDDAFRCFTFTRLLDYPGKKPYSTYEKRVYKGGYSDHLPLLLKVRVTQ